MSVFLLKCGCNAAPGLFSWTKNSVINLRQTADFSNSSDLHLQLALQNKKAAGVTPSLFGALALHLGGSCGQM